LETRPTFFFPVLLKAKGLETDCQTLIKSGSDKFD